MANDRTLSIKTSVQTFDECIGSTEDYITVSLTPKLQARIRQLHHAIAAVGADYIQEYGQYFRPRFDDRTSPKSVRLTVDKDLCFWFEGTRGGNDTLWESTSINLEGALADKGKVLDFRGED